MKSHFFINFFIYTYLLRSVFLSFCSRISKSYYKDYLFYQLISFLRYPAGRRSITFLDGSGGWDTNWASAWVPQSVHTALMLNVAATAACCHQCCLLLIEVNNRARIGRVRAGDGNRHTREQHRRRATGSKRFSQSGVEWDGEIVARVFCTQILKNSQFYSFIPWLLTAMIVVYFFKISFLFTLSQVKRCIFWPNYC